MNFASSAEFRIRVLAERRKLSAVEVDQLSRRAIARFLDRTSREGYSFKEKKIALYRSLPSELDLRSLEPILQAAGARLLFPRVRDRSAREIEFAEVPEPSHDPVHWDLGPYNIQEPHSSLAATNPEEIDLIFVPGAAFGENGERIGLGAGYYDRFLPRAGRALKVALAYDFQLFPSLPQNPWDQRVDRVITDLREAP